MIGGMIGGGRTARSALGDASRCCRGVVCSLGMKEGVPRSLEAEGEQRCLGELQRDLGTPGSCRLCQH